MLKILKVAFIYYASKYNYQYSLSSLYLSLSLHRFYVSHYQNKQYFELRIHCKLTIKNR